MASFIFPLANLSTSPKELKTNFDERLAAFLDFSKNLQKQGLLDGEILIAQSGKVLLDLQSKDLPTPEPQFMIGSVSKQFFAVALLKALYDTSLFPTEKSKIEDVQKQLQLPLSNFLPEESAIWAGDMPAWAHVVTLHHLLTHTSGIPNYTATDAFKLTVLDKRWYESYRTTSEIIKLISEEPLQFSPGSQFSYNNTGYVIIAEVIGAITGLPVSQYIQKALFDPIGLDSTANPVRGQWSVLKHDPKFSRLVTPFKYDPREADANLYPLQHPDDLSVAVGGGSLISAAADLLKWNESLHKDKTVLPSELYHLFIKPNLDNYGYGIGIEAYSMGTILGHNGGIGSYRSLLLYMPEQDLSIIILSNICSDFDKIESEFKEIEESLKPTVPDDTKRKDAATKMIRAKYPNTRGFEVLAERASQLFL